MRAPMQGVFQRIHDILIDDDVVSPSQVNLPLLLQLKRHPNGLPLLASGC